MAAREHASARTLTKKRQHEGRKEADRPGRTISAPGLVKLSEWLTAYECPPRLAVIPWRNKRRLAGNLPALVWGVAPVGGHTKLYMWLDRLRQEPQLLSENEVAGWQAELTEWLERPLEATSPWVRLESLFWLAVLPTFRAMWPLSLVSAAIDRIEACGDPGEWSADAGWAWRVQLAHELRLLIRWMYPGFAPAATWSQEARRAFRQLIQEWTDGNGLPRGESLGSLWRIVAVWARCQQVAACVGELLWEPEARLMAGRVLREAIRWSHPDGTQILDAAHESYWTRSLVRTALRSFPGDVPLDRVARMLLGKHVGRKGTAKRQAKPPASAATVISEWSGAALLRADWRQASAALAVVFAERDCQAELHAFRHPWLAGPLTTIVERRGEVAQVIGKAELICEFVDEDMRYCEWEYVLDAETVLQRQLALAPKDQFVLIADAVICRHPAGLPWKYCLRWPLAPGVLFQSARQTHEGWLVDEVGRTQLVLPLALPEWRADVPRGSLTTEHGQVVYELHGQGSAFFAPLWIDLAKHRRGQPFTWRRLTVGENRSRVPSDVAQGYRIQVGTEQWIVYRALRGAVPRTVLGQHWSSEYVIARFGPQGECQLLLDVETGNG